MTEVLARRHDVALLDLDGVVYIGDHAVPGAAEGLEAARAAGMRLAFVTNNAGRPPEDVAAHLQALAIPATADDVVTSSQAGARLLAERLSAGARVLAIGGPGVALALDRAGLSAVSPEDPSAAEVSAVLQGFGRDLAWSDLASAAIAIQSGAVWILTNPDLTLPMPAGHVPGNGSLARAVEAAAGRAPDEVAGKPHPALMHVSIERCGAVTPIAVGDRLDTDIAGAERAGIPSLLVLTGISGIPQLLAARPGERPTYVGGDLFALTAPPAATGGPNGPKLDDGRWRLPGSSAWMDGDVLCVEGTDWLGALQCACAAAWAQPDRVARVDAAAILIERLRRTVVP